MMLGALVNEFPQKISITVKENHLHLLFADNFLISLFLLLLYRTSGKADKKLGVHSPLMLERSLNQLWNPYSDLRPNHYEKTPTTQPPFPLFPKLLWGK